MKLSLVLGAYAATNLVLTISFQWFVATQLGPGRDTDALFAAMMLPQFVSATLLSSVSYVLVPLISGKSPDQQRQDAWTFAFVIGAAVTLSAVGVYLIAPDLIWLLVPGFEQDKQELTAKLLQIQLIGVVLSAINCVQAAGLNAKHKFAWSELMQLISSAIALASVVWALPQYGVFAVAWILVLRASLQTVLMTPGLGLPKWPDIKQESVRLAWQRIKPLLAGTAYYKTDPLVDRFMLSLSGPGTLSIYHLGQQILGAASQVISRAISAPLLPALAVRLKAADFNGFQILYRKKLLHVALISLIGLAALIFLGKPALNALVIFGRFTTSDRDLLWLVMLLMSGQFIIGNLGSIMTSVFYAKGDTRSPTRSGVIAYTLGVPIKVTLFIFYGVEGLAIGVSLYFLLSLLLMAKNLKDSCANA